MASNGTGHGSGLAHLSLNARRTKSQTKGSIFGHFNFYSILFAPLIFWKGLVKKSITVVLNSFL
jgi:hypothetical protein